MGKIYYLMGKSASGKDHIYENLIQETALDLFDREGFENVSVEERGAGRKRVFLCG